MMIYVVLILLTNVFVSKALPAPYYDLRNATQYFEDFIKAYDVHYANKEEKDARFEIFKNNLIDVNRLNAKSSTRRSGEAAAIFGVTQFMDLTSKEFENRYTGYGDINEEHSNCVVFSDWDIPYVNAPDSFDWRDEGKVTRVKHQGDCLSCYAFSTTGYLESQNAIKKGIFVELSEQQIVDCDQRSNGCNTGYMSYAFMSIIERGGIMSEYDYPYTETDGVCKFNPYRAAVVVGSCHTYTLQSQEKLKQLLYRVGPIPIAVSAGNFQKYNGGVFNDEQCMGPLDHAVLLVGYGIDPVHGPYWSIKNSYGPYFGEGGYIRVQRGEGAYSCGLMNPSMATATIL